MQKGVYWVILFSLTISFLLISGWEQPISAAEDSMVVEKVEVRHKGDVVYKEFIDTYIFGPDSEIEILMYVNNKLRGAHATPWMVLQSKENNTYVSRVGSHCSVPNPGVGIISCKFRPILDAESYTLEIPRNITVNDGYFVFTYTDRVDPIFGPREVDVPTNKLNLQKVTNMPKFTFYNKKPKMTLTPDPDDIRLGKTSHGFTGDYLIVDINDDILDPWDFRMKYSLYNFSSSNNAISQDWFEAENRNLISVPEEFRKGSFQIFIEMETKFGSSWAWTYHYDARGDGGVPRLDFARRLTMSSYNLWEGIKEGYWEFEAERRQKEFNEVYSQRFGVCYQGECELNPYTMYDSIGVFIFPHSSDYFTHHTGTAEDIDIENSGYQWSPYPDRLDPSRPIQKFSAENNDFIRATVYVSDTWRTKDGYWAFISDSEGITEDGTYYLHLVMKDKVSGGVKVEPITYFIEGNEPGKKTPNVTLLRDETPPTISFEQLAPTTVQITLEDPYYGVGITQLGISRTTGDTVNEYAWRGFGGYVSWYDLFPTRETNLDRSGAITQVDADPANRRVTITIDTDKLPLLQDLGEDEIFYLHVRTMDAGASNTYNDKFQSYVTGREAFTSRKLTKKGMVPSERPEHVIEYSNTGLTNQPVHATIHLPEGYRVLNNGGSTTRTFVENGTFTFKVWGVEGYEFDFPATVSNIDVNPPTITLNGPMTYPIYQGLAFDFTEPGFSAWDPEDGNITDRVQVDLSTINVYKSGYYEIIYTVTDRAGNTAREARGVSVYNNGGISILINEQWVRSGQWVAAGDLKLDIVGLQSDDYRLLYLPGKQKLGVFKEKGIPIVGNHVHLAAGWYTFFVQDENRTTAIVHLELK